MFWHIAPSTEGDTQVRDWWNRMMRSAMNPSASVEFMRMGMGIDIRDVLPAVNVPTLILHRTDDQVCHVENARYMASHIPDAKYVELPGNDHAPWVNGGSDILAEIQEFLTGVREPVQPDRVLATVMFTDIVSSARRPRWAIGGGAELLSDTTPHGVSRAVPRARGRHRRRRLSRPSRTGSSHPLRERSRAPYEGWASRSAWYPLANASCSTARSGASPSTRHCGVVRGSGEAWSPVP
jgi:hypothetical protein